MDFRYIFIATELFYYLTEITLSVDQGHKHELLEYCATATTKTFIHKYLKFICRLIIINLRLFLFSLILYFLIYMSWLCSVI